MRPEPLRGPGSAPRHPPVTGVTQPGRGGPGPSPASRVQPIRRLGGVRGAAQTLALAEPGPSATAFQVTSQAPRLVPHSVTVGPDSADRPGAGGWHLHPVPGAGAGNHDSDACHGLSELECAGADSDSREAAAAAAARRPCQ